MIIIYKYTNLINKKGYIGQAKNLQKRHNKHLYNAKSCKDTSYIDRAINKYGIDNFSREIIEYVNNEFADVAEEFWIAELKTLVPNGYNVKPGGSTSRGWKHTEETKNKLSIAHTGKVMSEEARLKMSKANIGKKMNDATKEKISKANKSKVISKEHKQKLVEANTGKVMSDETKEKLRIINTGKKQSEETKQKKSKSLMGNKNSLGYKHTEEAKRNMSGRTGDKNPRFGKQITEENRQNLINSHIGQKAWNKGKPNPDGSGENHKNSKLTNDKVIAIKQDTRSCKAIARDYNVSSSAIEDIKKGKTWKHIP